MLGSESDLEALYGQLCRQSQLILMLRRECDHKLFVYSALLGYFVDAIYSSDG